MENPDIVIGLCFMRDELKRNAIGKNEAQFLGRAELVNSASHEIVKLRKALGNLIDQWEMVPNDLLGSIEDGSPGLYAAMNKLLKEEGVK